jgi:hypothetical protein
MNSMASEKMVTLLDHLDQPFVVVAALPQSLEVEKGVGQDAQHVGVACRQMDADLELLAVLEVDLRVSDGRLAAAELHRRLVAQRHQHRLDVLAGAQRVGAEVGAFAGVVERLEAADRHPVLPARPRIGHLVVAENAVAAQVLDAELPLGRALAADVDLLLAQHRWPPSWAC